jgi:hypothetical protein
VEPGSVAIDAFNASSWGAAFAPVACVHAELAPGDLVYWPSRWYHQSLNAGRSVAYSSFALDRAAPPCRAGPQEPLLGPKKIV